MQCHYITCACTSIIYLKTKKDKNLQPFQSNEFSKSILFLKVYYWNAKMLKWRNEYLLTPKNTKYNILVQKSKKFVNTYSILIYGLLRSFH